MAIGNAFINISKQYLRVMFVIAAVFPCLLVQIDTKTVAI